MKETMFSFGPSPWEQWLRTKQMGDKVSAAELLTLLEAQEEEALEDALREIEMACMVLDVSDLPCHVFSGEAGVRLRQEVQLVKKGLHPDSLEENDPLRVYLEELAAIPAFGDEKLLAEEARRGREDAQMQLTNLGLSRVLELAQAYVGYGVLLLDLIQEGSLGLWQAVLNYHYGEYGPHRDRWINLYMAKAITLQARARGVGQRLRTAMEDYRSVDEKLLGDLGRNPTTAEIAEELHITVEETEAVRRVLDNARLMQKAIPRQEEPEEQEAQEQSVENTALFQSRQRIAELLSALNAQDQKLLTLRYGLEGGIPLSAEDTARRLGLTPDEVNTREAAALMQLRKG